MKNFDEVLDNLAVQKKQVEAQFLKIEGAIEIVNSMKKEKEDNDKELSKAQQVAKKK